MIETLWWCVWSLETTYPAATQVAHHGCSDRVGDRHFTHNSMCAVPGNTASSGPGLWQDGYVPASSSIRSVSSHNSISIRESRGSGLDDGVPVPNVDASFVDDSDAWSDSSRMRVCARGNEPALARLQLSILSDKAAASSPVAAPRPWRRGSGARSCSRMSAALGRTSRSKLAGSIVAGLETPPLATFSAADHRSLPFLCALRTVLTHRAFFSAGADLGWCSLSCLSKATPPDRSGAQHLPISFPMFARLLGGTGLPRPCRSGSLATPTPA